MAGQDGASIEAWLKIGSPSDWLDGKLSKFQPSVGKVVLIQKAEHSGGKNHGLSGIPVV